jgi:hypothetical protein
MLATPMTKVIAMVSAISGLRNRDNGMIGSVARRSRNSSNTTNTTDAAMSPRICGESHAYSVPPQMVINTSVDTAATSSVAPR